MTEIQNGKVPACSPLRQTYKCSLRALFIEIYHLLSRDNRCTSFKVWPKQLLLISSFICQLLNVTSTSANQKNAVLFSSLNDHVHCSCCVCLETCLFIHISCWWKRWRSDLYLGKHHAVWTTSSNRHTAKTDMTVGRIFWLFVMLPPCCLLIPTVNFKSDSTNFGFDSWRHLLCLSPQSYSVHFLLVQVKWLVFCCIL